MEDAIEYLDATLYQYCSVGYVVLADTDRKGLIDFIVEIGEGYTVLYSTSTNTGKYHWYCNCVHHCCTANQWEYAYCNGETEQTVQ